MKKKLILVIAIIFMFQNIVYADSAIQIVPFNNAIGTVLGVDKGQCGDNLEWSMSVTAQPELHITGTGDMYNYSEGTAPWSTSLWKVYLDDGVTSIGNYAFCDFTNLIGIDIPDNVTEIGYDAFKNCTALVSVDIPDNVKVIGSSAFECCSNLRYVTLPSNIKNIYHFTFAMCKNLEEIEIYDGVKEIGQGAFANCSNLTTIHIPNTIEKIGNRTFYGCNSLKTIYYGGSKSQWENISIESGNSPLDNAEIIYLTKDAVADKKICFICENEILNDSVFYDENGNVICKSCSDKLKQENKTKICFYCEKEIKDNEAFYDENDNLICQDCYNEFQNAEEETEKMLCQYCEKQFEITDDVYDINGNIICPYCDENLTQENDDDNTGLKCPYCGKYFDDSEDIYDSDGYAICPYCDEYIDNMEEITEEIEINFSTSEWAAEEVYEAYQNNLIPEEMLKDIFYENISRQEFAAIAVKLYEYMGGEISYIDIDDTPFYDCNYCKYSDYIAIAYYLGITNGTTNTTFSPYDNISREQLATMLYRVLLIADDEHLIEIDKSFNVSNSRPFNDNEKISIWAIEGVYFMAEYGIIKGVEGGNFAPQNFATKEQSIAISNRCVNSLLVN